MLYHCPVNYSIFIHGGRPIYVLSIVYLGCNVQENEFCLKTLFVCESRDVHETFSAETETRRCESETLQVAETFGEKQ